MKQIKMPLVAMLLSLLTIGTTEAQLLRKLGKAASNANTAANTVNAAPDC